MTMQRRSYALFQGEVFMFGPYSDSLSKVQAVKKELERTNGAMHIRYREGKAWKELPKPKAPRAYTSTEKEPDLHSTTPAGGAPERNARRSRQQLLRELMKVEGQFDFNPTLELLGELRSIRDQLDRAEAQILAFFVAKSPTERTQLP